jgi:hypothetical protein
MLTDGVPALQLLALVGFFFVLGEYILKVHVLMSSEHELCQILNTFVYIQQLLYLNKLSIFFVIKCTVKSHIQYYAKSEDNFNVANNFK